MAERQRGTRVPQRWWEQSVIDLSLAREKAAAEAERAGENVEETETPGSGAETIRNQPPRQGGQRAVPGGEASLGVSGSSWAEWSGAED